MLPPECAKRYRAERLLGQGAFGVVYRAVQVDLNRPVAIKVVTAAGLSDPEQRERFRNEALITASLDHPNIVRVLDHGIADAQPWIAFELVEGGALRELVKPGGWALADALAAARDVLAALEHAHARGVLHRDVKPENVLKDRVTGGFKVTDFGIAKWEREGAVRTQTGVVLGTPSYLAPEQLTAQASPASDQYAWGILLYELLSGAPPFAGDHPMQVLEQQLQAAPPPLAHVPAEVNALVMRALQKKPADRFGSTAAALAALDALAAPESAPNRTVRVSRAPSRSAATQVSRVEPPAALGTRTRGAAIAVGAAAAVLALTLIRPAPPPPPPAATVAPAADLSDLELAFAAEEKAERTLWPDLHEISKVAARLPAQRTRLATLDRLDAALERRLAGNAPPSRRALTLRARIGTYQFLVWSEILRLVSANRHGELVLIDPAAWPIYDGSGLPRLVESMRRVEDLLATLLPAGDSAALGEAFVLAQKVPSCFSPWAPVEDEKLRWTLAVKNQVAALDRRLGPAGAPFMRWLEEYWSRRMPGLAGAAGKRLNELLAPLRAAWPVAGQDFGSFKDTL